MIKVIGSLIIICVSLFIGYSLSDMIKNRIANISALSDFIEYISEQVSMYKLTLEDIYISVSNERLKSSGFLSNLKSNRGNIYEAAMGSGILLGDEEREIIKSFSDRIGSGTAEDVTAQCLFTSRKLKNIKDKLSSELPDKKRIYNTVSFLVGASAIILLM